MMCMTAPKISIQPMSNSTARVAIAGTAMAIAPKAINTTPSDMNQPQLALIFLATSDRNKVGSIGFSLVILYPPENIGSFAYG